MGKKGWKKVQGQNNDIIPERKVPNLKFIRSFVLIQKTVMSLFFQGRRQRDQENSKQSFIIVHVIFLCVSVTYCCICNSTMVGQRIIPIFTFELDLC